MADRQRRVRLRARRGACVTISWLQTACAYWFRPAYPQNVGGPLRWQAHPLTRTHELACCTAAASGLHPTSDTPHRQTCIKHTIYCRATIIATGDNHWTMRCFEVTEKFVFVCFANGKLAIHDITTQELLRPPIAAHTSEIKHIARGHGDILVTSCLDNQVRYSQYQSKTQSCMRHTCRKTCTASQWISCMQAREHSDLERQIEVLQVRTWHCAASKVQSSEALGPVAICNDASKQVNFILPVTCPATSSSMVRCTTRVTWSRLGCCQRNGWMIHEIAIALCAYVAQSGSCNWALPRAKLPWRAIPFCQLVQYISHPRTYLQIEGACDQQSEPHLSCRRRRCRFGQPRTTARYTCTMTI